MSRLTPNDLVHKQLIATAELARAAVAAGLRDTVMLYVPGDAPIVTRAAIFAKLEIATDGQGTFDIWQKVPREKISKPGLSLDEAVAFLCEAKADLGLSMYPPLKKGVDNAVKIWFNTHDLLLTPRPNRAKLPIANPWHN